MLGKAILLGLAAMLGHANLLGGTNLMDRPIIICTLTGLIMGDVQAGLMIGAMMELAFIGAFSVGASLPPEMISGGILGTALTIASGNETELALTIGIPVASLALILKNACKVFILPHFIHKADYYASKGNSKGISRMHLLGGFLYFNLPLGLLVAFSFYFGNSVIYSILNLIPEFIKNGLIIGTGLMPALGFAVLTSMILNKENAVFLLFGFWISAYLKIPVTGVAIFGVITALALASTQRKPMKVQEQEKAKDVLLSKKDLRKVFWRSFTMEWSWNYERQANLGYGFAMIPIIEKLYKNKPEEKVAALQRHLEFFNTTPHISTLILGISSAMEEQNVKQKNFDIPSINHVKAALMGPVAGVGDSLFWGTLRIVATGIGTSLAFEGKLLGPVLFLLIFNIPHVLLRYFCMMGGYKFGADFLGRLQKNGLMERVTSGASIVGLMSIGAMVSTMVIVHLTATYQSGGASMALYDALGGIVPGLMPLLFTGFIYWLIKKKHLKSPQILFIIIMLSILGSMTGVLSV